MRLVALLLVVCAPVASASPLALGELLARVDERGPEAELTRAEAAIAAADVHSASMFPNPALSLSAGRSEPLFAASLQLRLPIFGQRGARIDAAERARAQAFGEAAAARWHLRHEARLAYYAQARADDEVTIAVELEALTRRIAEMAAEKYSVGTGTKLDERQAELLHVRTLQDVSDRRAALAVARIELARQMGVAEPGSLANPLNRVGSTPPIDELLAAARAQHPTLAAAHAEAAAARAREKSARADRRPTLTLDLGVEVLDPATCAGTRYCAGPRGALGFDLPIFNWNGGPIERAKAEARLAEWRAQVIDWRVTSGVQAAEQNLAAAERRARFFDGEYLPSAIAVEEMAKEAFAVGKSGILPLIEAERAVLDARLGRTEALFAVQSARADLEEQSGVALSAP